MVGDRGPLLAKANAGDSRACATFLRANTPVLRGVVQAKGGGPGEAVCEDVLQEAFNWRPVGWVKPTICLSQQ